MSQTVRAAPAWPVIGNKDGVGANRFHNHGLQRYVATPGSDRDPVTILDAVLFRQSRMNLHARIGKLVEKPSDTARLRSRKVLAHNATGREIDRILGGHRVAAFPPVGHDEVKFA